MRSRYSINPGHDGWAVTDGATGDPVRLFDTIPAGLDHVAAEDIASVLDAIAAARPVVARKVASPYGARPAADRHDETEVLRRDGVSDIARWADAANLHAAWDARARAVASIIVPPAIVIDLGCGTMALERELAPAICYIPADIVARDARTHVFDANDGLLPDVEADVATCLGVIEYVHDPAMFLRAVAARWSRLILTYNPADLDIGRDRRTHGWFNDLRSAEIVHLAAEAGWETAAIVPIDDRQRLYDLRRRP